MLLVGEASDEIEVVRGGCPRRRAHTPSSIRCAYAGRSGCAPPTLAKTLPSTERASALPTEAVSVVGAASSRTENRSRAVAFARLDDVLDRARLAPARGRLHPPRGGEDKE